MKRKYEEINSSSILINIDDKCPICMDKLKENNLTITKCGHKFCHTCLDSHSYKDNKCPICRTDMETKKKKTLCNCAIIESVSESLRESNPYLNNLCKRITKKFLNIMVENEFENKDIENNQEFKDIRKKISDELGDDKNFRFQILKFLFEEISYFSFVNSNNSCLYLKTLFEE